MQSSAVILRNKHEHRTTFSMWAIWAWSTRCCRKRAWWAPANAVIGADSHTCTYGALGAFSTGVGSTDMAAGMATGEAWFKVPGAIKFNLTGKLGQCVSRQGCDFAHHRHDRRGRRAVPVDGVFRRGVAEPFAWTTGCVMANMAIEAGAKNGIFPVDDDDARVCKGPGKPPVYGV